MPRAYCVSCDGGFQTLDKLPPIESDLCGRGFLCTPCHEAELDRLGLR